VQGVCARVQGVGDPGGDTLLGRELPSWGAVCPPWRARGGGSYPVRKGGGTPPSPVWRLGGEGALPSPSVGPLKRMPGFGSLSGDVQDTGTQPPSAPAKGWKGEEHRGGRNPPRGRLAVGRCKQVRMPGHQPLGAGVTCPSITCWTGYGCCTSQCTSKKGGCKQRLPVVVGGQSLLGGRWCSLAGR